MQKKIHNLAISGGGFFGYAEVAALKELENYKEYFDIQQISGVSVGSMIVALYAVGYTVDELSKIIFEFDFDKLIKDGMLPYIRLYEKYGMYEATKLEEEIERLIRIKTNIKYCTFNQISMNLTIISTNLNMQCPRFFNREKTPTVPISKAVRLSIGYPLVMTPVLYEGDYYGDGGIYMNYPITLYENSLDQSLGFTFAAYNENNNGTLKSRVPINDIYDFIKSMGVTMSRSAYVSQISQKYLDHSVIIHINQHISSMQFDLTKEQKMYIYNCGVKAVQEQIGNLLGINTLSVVKIDTNVGPDSNITLDTSNRSTKSQTEREILEAVKHIMTSDPETICHLITENRIC